MRVAIVQLELHDTPEKAIEHAIDQINKASMAESDIICLPEKWYPDAITDIEKELSAIIDISKDTCIIAGALVEKVEGAWYISSPVIEDEKIIGRQFKIHPFMSERDMVRNGNKLYTFDYKGTKFGIAICHDIVFPEISRRLTLKGVDMIFYPSRIHDEGIEPWHVYLQARALENRIVAVAPNLCNNRFGGRSMIVDISYNEVLDIAKPIIVEASANNEQILIGDIDVENIRKVRRVRLDELRDDYYSL